MDNISSICIGFCSLLVFPCYLSGCITHLPQIAARGKTHYKVYKEDNDETTVSHIKCLTFEERVEEIAHMLSGSELTSAAKNNARELLKDKE